MRATFFAVAAFLLTAQAGAQQPVERRISCTVTEVWASPVTGEIKRTNSTSIVVPHTRAGHVQAEAQFERERASAAAAFLQADTDWRKCPAGSPCQAEAFTRSLEYFVAREAAAKCVAEARLTAEQVAIAGRAAERGLEESVALIDAERANLAVVLFDGRYIRTAL